MQVSLNPRGDAQVFLTQFVVSGLGDDRYVIQRFVSQADREIVPVHANGTRLKRRRKARGTIMPEKIRSAHDEIITATGVKLRNCGE